MSKSSAVKLLRGSVSTSPGPSSQPTGSFVLPCRKLIINYSESNVSSSGVRNLLRTQNSKPSTSTSTSTPTSTPSDQTIDNDRQSIQQNSNAEFLQLLSRGPNQKSDSKLNSSHNILDVAHRFPQTEIVVQQNESREPTLTAIYINSRSKIIPLSNLSAPSILQKVQLALDSSGRKMEISHRRRPVESVVVGARGVWSPLHGERKAKRI